MRENKIYRTYMAVLIVAMAMLTAQMAWAQGNRATVTGTVVDSSGALLGEVEVRATNVETGISTVAQSNDRGIYSVLNLPPGTYAVHFSKSGFKPVDYSRITLLVAQVAELNVSLQVGGTSETVTVTTDAALLETETSTVGTNMNGNVVTDLPLNIYGGRQIESFAVAITPGYSPLSSPYMAVINGTQGFTKDFTVDGTSATAQIQGDSMEIGPSMEAVEELQAQTSGLSAKSASTNGGVMMFNLKSGTNKFHGSAFGFGHNEFLDANNWDNGHLMVSCLEENPGDTSSCGQYRKSKARFWNYGFSAGGPIIKDKTFIFGAFERYTQNDFTLGDFSATVPTPDFLQGNFGALLNTSVVLGTDIHDNPIYQGAIFNPSDPGAVFVGNTIPSNMFSSVSQKILAIYQKSYAPSLSGLYNNNRLPASNSPSQTPNQAVIKVDHNLTQNDRLSGSWIYNHRPRTLVDSGGVWSAGSTDGGPLSSARYQIVKSNELRASESHTFSGRLLNVFNATYNEYSNGSVTTASGNWAQTLGFGDTGADNFPAISFGASVNGIGETSIGNSWQGDYTGSTLILGNQLTWTKGRHTLSFGAEFRAMQINSHSGSGALSFNFNNNQTGAPTESYANQVGFGFASFLLGNVQSAQETTPFNLYGRRKAMSLYAQDDFKVRRDLTLNLGLRWDVNFRFHEKYGHWASFDLNAIDPTLDIPGTITYAKNGSDSFERYQDWKNFGPQVGFAYNPWTKVVFRGSYGIQYVPLGIQYWQGVPYGFDPGYRGTNAATTMFNWDSGYPGVFTPGTQTTIPDSSMVFVPSIDPHSLEVGYTHSFNFGVQFQLTKNTRIEASYIGNRGKRLQDSGLAYNEPSPSVFFNLVNSGHFYDWVYDQASADAAGVPFPYAGFSNYAFVAQAPYPQLATWADTWNYYPNMYVEGYGKGTSYYDSFVLELTKRVGGGLTLDFNYALSQQKGNTFNNFGDSYDVGYIQDFTNLDREAQTLSPYDQKHIFKGYVVYRLPFGRGQRVLGGAGKVLNSIVNGWSLSGLFLYTSGKPLSFSSSNYYWWPAWSATNVDYHLAGYHGRKFDPGHYVVPITDSSDPNCCNPTPSQDLYFPASVATDPAYGQLGTGLSRVDALRGFGSANEDASILKYFSFGNEGRYKLSVRFEFYNIFNRHGFQDPITTTNDARFGYVPGISGSPRSGQFGARFTW